MPDQKEISRFKSLPTPFYYYNLEVLDKTLKEAVQEAGKYNFHVHYAFKANANDRILEMIRSYGLGADCVSGNEIRKAAEFSFPPESIVFAGVGKTDKEISTAIDHDIFCFNCESLPEMEVINQIAAGKNKKVRIALRINPNINPKTHHYITTGLEENKFGINAWELEKVVESLADLHNLSLTGLHFHIGSQITDLSVFKGLCLRVNEIQQWFHDRHIKPRLLNLGGGLGVDYVNPDQNLIPDFRSYFKIFHDFIEHRPDRQIHFELGRSIVAQCGTLISKVLYVKKGINTNFVIVDAGMTELLRPALYQAYHKIENLTSYDEIMGKYDVVGPICESSDCFGKSVMLPGTRRGDLIAIRTTGAYGEVMASQYNLRDLVRSYYNI
jgi:diaminopimelate decarboxylase